MNEVNKHYDVIVVGAGMIGATMAIGLAKEGCRILLLEDIKPISFNPSEQPDLRVSSLNFTSVNLLKNLGVWKSVVNMRVAPYRRLEAWERENNHLLFEASTLGLPVLGYIVENRILQLALWKQFPRYSNLNVLCPVKLVSMQRFHHQWKIKLDNKQQFLTNLIIAADGVNSIVRTLSGIGSNGWGYDQSCLLITVKMNQSSEKDITWQQFFPSGPRAFLPLFDHWACLVWYDKPIRIKQLQSMSLEELRKEIILSFPSRLGEVQVIAKGSFSFTRHHANRYVEEGLALIGDAAHSINPLAGQGANLGYRDIYSLLKVMINARIHFQPYYSRKTLLVYQKNRIRDNKMMQMSIDIIHILFRSQSSAIKYTRNLSLMLLHRLHKIKKKFLKYALGL